MSRDTWVAIIVSVPISLITGLLVSPIQQWWHRRRKNQEEEYRAFEREIYERVLYLMAHPQELIEELIVHAIHAVIAAIFMGASFGALLLFIFTPETDSPWRFASWIFMVASVVLNFFGGKLLTKSVEALLVYRQIKNPAALLRMIPPDERDMTKEVNAFRVRRQILEIKEPTEAGLAEPD